MAHIGALRGNCQSPRGRPRENTGEYWSGRSHSIEIALTSATSVRLPRVCIHLRPPPVPVARMSHPIARPYSHTCHTEMRKPTVVCLAPVKNEAWALEYYLATASLWADVIIVADQQSDDGTRAIVDRCPKARLIENTSPAFNESSRQDLLIDAARSISGPRVLIALDADEILSANVLTDPEWQTAMAAPPGTVITFTRAEIWPDGESYWLMDCSRFHLGFVDDGSAHHGQDIHGLRIPHPVNANTVDLTAIHVLHYQYADWERMRSKHRWYQCWECLNHPERHVVDVFRQYHHMFSVGPADRRPIPREWVEAYEERGIDRTTVFSAGLYYWDFQVLELLRRHGAAYFKRVAIWDVDWRDIATRGGLAGDDVSYGDPRSLVERVVFSILYASQRYAGTLPVRGVNALLKLAGW